jgi:hypothetical protein
VVEAWNAACHRADAHPNFVRQDEEACLFFCHIRHGFTRIQIKCDSMKFLTDMKTKIKHAVDSSYQFDTSRAPDSISRNVHRAQALLAKTTFIYRVRLIASHLQPIEHRHMVHRISTLASARVIHIDIP